MSRLIDLSGRRALVTGGSRGIGRAVAVMLAEAGAQVGIGYRADREAAERTLRDLAVAAGEEAGPEPWAHAADLASESGVTSLFRRADEAFGGKLDIFVGNAGIWNEDARPIRDLDLDEWRAMMDANLTSAYLTARAAIRRMGDGGRIVLITSTAAQRGEAGHSHYAASKGALQSFVKSIAVEAGPEGVTVNAVAPGWVDTDMSAGTLQGDYRETVVSGIPVGRIASAEDIAGPVVFLASPLARHVTGEILNVNGGGVLCG
jgi:3-oxoacyl-[acyl-carrier protein] reductase